jgi:hypothetical protein
MSANKEKTMNYRDVLLRRRLVRAAKPYYQFTGPNDWTHISDVRARATSMVHKLYGRGLSPAEYAAVLFHDCTKHDLGADNHAVTGAERASAILHRLLARPAADRAVEAIAVHDANLPAFPSVTAELLASADANPPDAAWMLNKSYNWQLRHGIQDPIAGVMKAMPGKYGTNGKFNYPGIYKLYYGNKLKAMQGIMDTLTPESALRIIQDYRERNGLSMDTPGSVAPKL